MSRILCFAAAAALAFGPAARADVIPITSVYGYTGDDGATTEDNHYESGVGALAFDRSQTSQGIATSFGGKADRVGAQVVLGARVLASGGSVGQSTYVGAGANYSAAVNITPTAGASIQTLTTADFQIALHGTMAGGTSAWFSLFNNGAGVYGTGQPSELWATDGVAHSLQYVADANSGYTVDGVVDFAVPLTVNGDGTLTAALQLGLNAGVSATDGAAAVADFMNTAKLVAITFPELGGKSADDLGFGIDFAPLPLDAIGWVDGGAGGGPAAGGPRVPEPTSLLVWGGVAVLLLPRRRED